MNVNLKKDVWTSQVPHTYECLLAKFDYSQERILTEDEVLKLTGADKLSITRWQQAGEERNFPEPVILGMDMDGENALIGWRFSEIHSWINSRPNVWLVSENPEAWDNPPPPSEVRPGRKMNARSASMLALKKNDSMTVPDRQAASSLRVFCNARGIKVIQKTQSDKTVRFWRLA